MNSGILFLIITLTSFVIPGVLVLIREIPREGLTYGSTIGLLLVFVAAFFGIRTLLDLIRLVDLTSDFLVSQIPGLRKEKRGSIVRALKELVAVLVMVISASIVSPILTMVPNVGGYLLLQIIPFVLAIPSIILLYDAGKTLYAIFESTIEFLIEKLASGKRS